MSKIESELLAQFEAHKRVAEGRSEVLKQYESHDAIQKKHSDERGAVIESFEKAHEKIMNTAIDRVERRRRIEEENQRRRLEE